MSGGLSVFLTVLAIVVAGLLSAWFAGRALNIQNTGAIAIAFFIPMLAYALVSGTLVSVTAPGGVGATFRGALQKQIDPRSTTIAAEAATMIEKSGIEHLSDAFNLSSRNPQPVLLTLTLHGSYQREMLRTYLNALRALPNFKFLVLIDRDHKLVAYLTPTTATQILQDENAARMFLTDVTEGLIAELTNFTGIVTKSLPSEASNREALELMASMNVDALVVTDREQHVQGLVERSEVMTKLMLALAS